jgi:hypothetical protein
LASSVEYAAGTAGEAGVAATTAATKPAAVKYLHQMLVCTQLLDEVHNIATLIRQQKWWCSLFTQHRP